uniref:Uncharacterized protein n=1 Tax=Leptobrachium leishanense TaxID=445787 RepID=A0A8C5MI46_9ANUR
FGEFTIYQILTDFWQIQTLVNWRALLGQHTSWRIQTIASRRQLHLNFNPPIIPSLCNINSIKILKLIMMLHEFPCNFSSSQHLKSIITQPGASHNIMISPL